jgi:hypothetical protein
VTFSARLVRGLRMARARPAPTLIHVALIASAKPARIATFSMPPVTGSSGISGKPENSAPIAP